MEQVEQKKGFPIWGWFFVFFGIIFIANGFLVYFANSSWNGVVSEKAYERGLSWNETLEKREQQKALGWQMTMGFVPMGDLSGSVEVTLKDKAGNPLDQAIVKATAWRPTHEGVDIPLDMKAVSGQAGLYRADVSFPLYGIWDVKFAATLGDDMFEAKKRIDIPAPKKKNEASQD